MPRRKGAGMMARKLKRTKGGNKVKRRHVKLDMSGMKKFLGVFGTGKNPGITFTMGLFSPEVAYKGLKLEFGSDRQVARPWLSSTLTGQSGTTSQILKVIGKFTRDAFAGRDSKKDTQAKLLKLLQQHLQNQMFSATKLTDGTIRQKRAKGAVAPTLIGIDTYDMATKLEVRTKGSLNRNIRGK